MEMKLTIEGLEKERDFYFGKLRDIEVRTDVADIEFRNKTLGYKQIVVQEMGGDNDEQGREILDILYATEEGFAVPDDPDDDDVGY